MSYKNKIEREESLLQILGYVKSSVDLDSRCIVSNFKQSSHNIRSNSTQNLLKFIKRDKSQEKWIGFRPENQINLQRNNYQQSSQTLNQTPPSQEDIVKIQGGKKELVSPKMNDQFDSSIQKRDSMEHIKLLKKELKEDERRLQLEYFTRKKSQNDIWSSRRTLMTQPNIRRVESTQIIPDLKEGFPRDTSVEPFHSSSIEAQRETSIEKGVYKKNTVDEVRVLAMEQQLRMKMNQKRNKTENFPHLFEIESPQKDKSIEKNHTQPDRKTKHKNHFFQELTKSTTNLKDKQYKKDMEICFGSGKKKNRGDFGYSLMEQVFSEKKRLQECEMIKSQINQNKYCNQLNKRSLMFQLSEKTVDDTKEVSNIFKDDKLNVIQTVRQLEQAKIPVINMCLRKKSLENSKEKDILQDLKEHDKQRNGYLKHIQVSELTSPNQIKQDEAEAGCMFKEQYWIPSDENSKKKYISGKNQKRITVNLVREARNMNGSLGRKQIYIHKNMKSNESLHDLLLETFQKQRRESIFGQENEKQRYFSTEEKMDNSLEKQITVLPLQREGGIVIFPTLKEKAEVQTSPGQLSSKFLNKIKGVTASPLYLQHSPVKPLQISSNKSIQRGGIRLKEAGVDSINIMQQTLLKRLYENEVMRQYIEKSGYSLELFSFYMVKLYSHCIQKPTDLETNISNLSELNISSAQSIELPRLDSRHSVKQEIEFATLKVNEGVLLFVRDVFCQKMIGLQMANSVVRGFEKRFLVLIKKFLPSAFLEELGGVESVRFMVTKLLEYLCYESGMISSFDQNLIEEVLKGTLCLLRFEQSLLETYLDILKNNGCSNAEIYQVKIILWRIWEQISTNSYHQLRMIQQNIEKQRGSFQTTLEFCKDNSLRGPFQSSIAKNKKITGYFLDPSTATINQFYDSLFGCLFGTIRYVDFIDFLQRKLKTQAHQIPGAFLDEVMDIIIELTRPYAQFRILFLLQKDLLIKKNRIKQKAGLISYEFLNLQLSPREIASQLTEWCEYTLIRIKLPPDLKDDAVIKPKFMEEYLHLVLNEHEQVFSIYDMDYALSYHNIQDFEFCFPLWLHGLQDILSKNNTISQQDLSLLIEYLQLNSLLNIL